MSKDKIAIVTGGSRGIGRSTVLAQAKRGVRALFTYNSNRAEADKVVARAAEAGAPATASSSMPASSARSTASRLEVAGGIHV
jgi:NAD(P)-dependent dehydrogenase (short-subunit alcohol dehydrogenase family)